MGIPLLAAAFLFHCMGFHAPSRGEAREMPLSGVQRGTPSARAPSSGHSAGEQMAVAVTDSAEIHIDVRALSKAQPNSGSAYELRAETRELSLSIADLYNNDSLPPESLRFPLFDGRFVQLKALRHQSMGVDQGLVFAAADGEPEGGHVLLSYVGTALAGMIHLPYRGEFYEIRTAPDGRSHILTQLNPDKMPVCGGCLQHPVK